MNQELLSHFLRLRKVSTDTRTIRGGEIFFALRGENFDGNRFAAEALNKGATIAVVSDPDLKGENYFHVPDTLTALQELARAYRQTLSIPVIGIGGSNGKTTTKELLNAVLNTKLNTFVTRGNLNNHIGLPLSILSIEPQHELAVLELGSNQSGDYEMLCNIALPDYALITNMGKDHLEGFGSEEGVIRAHGEIADFIRKNNGRFFVDAEDESLVKLAEGCETLPYMTGSLRAEAVGKGARLTFKWKNAGYESKVVETNLTGAYNLKNIMAALAIGVLFGVDEREAERAISAYEPNNNRSQIVTTANGNTVIADCYNANPTSMEAALNNLASLEHPHKFFILGDMLELGHHSAEEHRLTLDLAVKLGLGGHTVGPLFSEIRAKGATNWTKAEDLIEFLKNHPPKDSLILLKGSRGIALERLIDWL
jgi:UDP-N-acetylmuramoyl-tripeptide--D-alanyl-D-alanine ligase